jgi:hypothetical protein
MDELTRLTRRVHDNAEDVRNLEGRLAIARNMLDLSEKALDQFANPTRKAGVVDLVDGILRHSMASHSDATSAALDIWRALRRNGFLKDD